MTTLTLEHPTVDDGLPVWRLVKATGVLDVNSSYCYAAQFRNFAKTCVVAREGDGSVVGFITGYLLPEHPDVLWIWQVGVDERGRGQGLATRMLRWLAESTGARFLETTVTPDNAPSRALFRGFARKLETDCSVSDGISGAQLGGGHEPEELFRIGPLPRSNA